MRIIIFKVLCYTLLLWSCNAKQELTSSDLQFSSENCYTVDQIKCEKNIYIIYASKNNKPYKILSRRKSPIFRSRQVKIQCGGTYCLQLDSLMPRVILGIKMMPPGGGGPTGIEFYGIDVFIEPEKKIGDLFEANNLNGLFIKKKYCKP